LPYPVYYATISFGNKQMSVTGELKGAKRQGYGLRLLGKPNLMILGRNIGVFMDTSGSYFVVKKKAVPEVLIKVLEAKRLLETGRAASVHEAAEQAGISRSSFYKYKDDIFEFHDSAQGTTITLMLQIDDEPGVLSEALKVIAGFHANILTIHQSIPINGVASLSVSVQVLPATGDVSQMLEALEGHPGVHYAKALAKE